MNLTFEQNKAISEINNNLQIIACAGSGKTEVITRRIANILSRDNICPSDVVSFTFTVKATESMKNRINKVLSETYINKKIININDMYIGTIHSFCFNVLKNNCQNYKNFKILNNVTNYLFIKRYHNECGMKELNLEYNSHNANLFIKCIEKMVDDYANYDSWKKNVQDAFNKYKNCIYSKGYFDFSFLIYETVEQLKHHPEFIKNIHYLICDEYQDVNDLQEKIIEIMYKNGTNICVVGDDDQSIYRIQTEAILTILLIFQKNIVM